MRLQARRVPLPGQAGTHDGCAGDGNSGGGENLPPGHVPGQVAVRLVNRILVLLTRLLQSGSEIIMLLRQLRTQLKAPEGISCLQLCLYGIRELASVTRWTSLICVVVCLTTSPVSVSLRNTKTINISVLTMAIVSGCPCVVCPCYSRQLLLISPLQSTSSYCSTL